MNPRDPRHRKSNIPAEFFIKNKKKGKDWHWSLTIILVGGLAGGMATYALMTVTMLRPLHLFLGILGVGTLAFLAQWKYFYSPVFIEKYFRLHISIYALYNFVGVGFLLSALFLGINWLGAGEEIVERHRIVGIDNNYVRDSNTLTVMLLENDAYQDDPAMRAAPYLEVRRKTYPFFDLLFSKGLFGINIYKGYRMSKDPNAKPEEETEEPVVEEEIPQDSVLLDSTGISPDSL